MGNEPATGRREQTRRYSLVVAQRKGPLTFVVLTPGDVFNSPRLGGVIPNPTNQSLCTLTVPTGCVAVGSSHKSMVEGVQERTPSMSRLCEKIQTGAYRRELIVVSAHTLDTLLRRDVWPQVDADVIALIQKAVHESGVQRKFKSPDLPLGASKLGVAYVCACRKVAGINGAIAG